LRLPVLLMSTACIPLTYWLGRRAFSSAAGLVAAAGLAMAADAILWGGRVRMYAPLQFFALALTAVFYLWVVEERDRPLYRWLFVLAFWAAVFCHAEAMLLLPVLGIWALLQRGSRWCLQPGNLAAFALAGLSIAVEILLRRLGPPVQARVAPGVFEPQARQYLGAGIDWPGVVKVVEPLFLAPERLAATLLALAGLAWIVLRLARSRRLAGGSRGRALVHLYALLLPVLLLLLFVVDPEWKSPRYGLMLLPHYFLVAAAVLAAAGRALARFLPAARGRLAASAPWAVPAAVVVLVLITSWPSALEATRETVPDYEWAFAAVAEQSRPGDQVITFLCPAAFWHLGRCDYLAAPTDFSGFAVQRDGRWVSGWDLVPIVDSAAGLRQVLDTGRRTWFVVDEGRLAGRYDAEFLETVLSRMDLVAQEREMVIFLGPR
ncbi:MAG TPA: glycosyltransferase family 39 protein, partial [Anaerolineae bacterium]|nr:glycosyltransferase family 39 protein [Anaerolineae bacterium]